MKNMISGLMAVVAISLVSQASLADGAVTPVLGEYYTGIMQVQNVYSFTDRYNLSEGSEATSVIEVRVVANGSAMNPMNVVVGVPDYFDYNTFALPVAMNAVKKVSLVNGVLVIEGNSTDVSTGKVLSTKKTVQLRVGSDYLNKLNIN